NVIDKHIDNTDDFETILPGMRLRQLREKSNVSIKHVADRLFLDVMVIEKLENDDYKNLPPTIFVRGYMRNYAKLLDVKPESILEEFDPDGKQPKLHTQEKRKEQANRHDLLPTLGTISIIIVSLVLVAMWISSPESTPSIELLPDPQIKEQPIFPPESSNTEDPSESGEVASDSTEQPVNAESTSNDTSEAEIPPINYKTLKINFKARTWMRVTDKTKASLYEGISSSGKILSLDGTPPFYLRVGNIDGVDIEYKGETRSVKAYSKKGNLYVIGSESQ
ncbi:MAG: DUF4115 domain-containing protein, partial [Proteobacteria bacterium]|nr:DUF4115 domain-containing protein [Pseudomonadota bacterium]